MTAANPARRFRYRPAPLPAEKSADLMESARIVAGMYPCEMPGCDRRARGRFAGVRLCEPHHTEAIATAYAMENAL